MVRVRVIGVLLMYIMGLF